LDFGAFFVLRNHVRKLIAGDPTTPVTVTIVALIAVIMILVVLAGRDKSVGVEAGKVFSLNCRQWKGKMRKWLDRSMYITGVLCAATKCYKASNMCVLNPHVHVPGDDEMQSVCESVCWAHRGALQKWLD